MIEGILVAAVTGAVGLAAYWRARSAQHARVRAWLQAASSCGVVELTPAEIVGFPQEVSGRKDGLDVQIGSYKRGKNTRGTRIVVSPLGAVTRLALRVEGLGSAIMKTLGTREVEVGDPDFDGRFLIEGPMPLALAVLDASTRRQVWNAMGGLTVVHGTDGDVSLKADAHLANGRLYVEIPEAWHVKLEVHLAGALRTILDTAANLAVARDVPHQLAENALHDPLWAVRLTNLKTMAREFPGHPETPRMLSAACADASEEIRLSAAVALGRDGDPTLLELAFGNAPDAIAARAVAALDDRLPIDRALPCVGESVDSGRLETAAACLEALSRHAPAGLATAEPTLLRALAHPPARLRIAAARGLGRIGTAAAVLPLREAAQRFGGDFSSACREAVAAIQARASGARPGQLSVVDGEAGHLTLARETGGEVSPAGED